jgi:hypothetical protein
MRVMFRPNRTRRLWLLAGLFALLVATGCVPRSGPLVNSYITDEGATGQFASERDCGFTAEVAGTSSLGSTVQRTIWGFCDPVGYDIESGALFTNSGVPPNGYGIGLPGAEPTSVPIVSPVLSNTDGSPATFLPFIPAMDNDCIFDVAPYPREWILGMVTVPDNEPRFETIAIFYQNLCINFDGDIIFGPAGLAMARWDADNPDGLLQRDRVADYTFRPGLQRDERVPWEIRHVTYGAAPILVPGGGEEGQDRLYLYNCGGGADCNVAMIDVSPNLSGVENLARLVDTSQWRYHAAEGWVSFPPQGRYGTCAPTEFDDCGGFPVPTNVADARADGGADPNASLTRISGEVSVREFNGIYYMLYAFEWDNGFAYRSATRPEGPFSDPVWLGLPNETCAQFCRAPIWQPQFDTDLAWGVTYYDRRGLNDLVAGDRYAGRLEMTYLPPLPPGPQAEVSEDSSFLSDVDLRQLAGLNG